VFVATLQAGPREELLRLVPADAGLTVMVQNLRGHAEQLAESPLMALLRQRGIELPELQAIDPLVKAQIGVTIAELRDDLLGDCIVLSDQAPPDGQPQQNRTLMLVWVRKPELLQRLIQQVNMLEGVKANPEIAHAGHVYHRRVKANQTDYYFIRGSVFGMSDREDMIRAALERDRDTETVAQREPALSKSWRALGILDDLVVLSVRPREYDRDMRHQRDATKSIPEKAFLTNFIRYWESLDSVAVSVRVGAEIDVTLAMRMRTADLSISAQRFLQQASRGSLLQQLIPEKALFSFDSRWDVAAFSEMFGEFLSEEMRRTFRTMIHEQVTPLMGRDAFKEVLNALGPDWLAWIAPNDKALFPEVAMVLRIQTPEAEKRTRQSLQQLAFLARYSYNRAYPDHEPIVIESVDGLTYLANTQIFPPGVQPAFAVGQGYLYIASHPDVVQRLMRPLIANGSIDSTWIRLSFRHLQAWLTRHRTMLAKMNRDWATEQIDTVISALQWLDRCELQVESSDADTARFRLRIVPIAALRR